MFCVYILVYIYLYKYLYPTFCGMSVYDKPIKFAKTIVSLLYKVQV